MSKPLFIGLSNKAPGFYRCGLPANALGWDWAGITIDPPPTGVMVAGNMSEYPDLDDYDVIICQQPKGDSWLRFIKDLRKQGKIIIFECDDFLHGVNRVRGHKFAKEYNKKEIRKFVECMKASDGMIVSTEFLAEQYKKYNPNIQVCKNGIDTARYEVEPAERDSTIIGWAGGTGHHTSIGPWLEAVSDVLYMNNEANFISIGVNYGDLVNNRFPGRAISIPWVSLENLPYALSHFDIAIAPGHVSKYHKSKSDLRWLEASAVGIPTIASPQIYHEIEHEKTGLLTDDPSDVAEYLDELIYDKKTRKELGKNAQEYVQANRDISETAKQWEIAINNIVNN